MSGTPGAASLRASCASALTAPGKRHVQAFVAQARLEPIRFEGGAARIEGLLYAIQCLIYAPTCHGTLGRGQLAELLALLRKQPLLAEIAHAHRVEGHRVGGTGELFASLIDDVS